MPETIDCLELTPKAGRKIIFQDLPSVANDDHTAITIIQDEQGRCAIVPPGYISEFEERNISYQTFTDNFEVCQLGAKNIDSFKSSAVDKTDLHECVLENSALLPESTSSVRQRGEIFRTGEFINKHYADAARVWFGDTFSEKFKAALPFLANYGISALLVGLKFLDGAAWTYGFGEDDDAFYPDRFVNSLYAGLCAASWVGMINILVTYATEMIGHGIGASLVAGLSRFTDILRTSGILSLSIFGVNFLWDSLNAFLQDESGDKLAGALGLGATLGTLFMGIQYLLENKLQKREQRTEVLPLVILSLEIAAAAASFVYAEPGNIADSAIKTVTGYSVVEGVVALTNRIPDAWLQGKLMFFGNKMLPEHPSNPDYGSIEYPQNKHNTHPCSSRNLGGN